MNVLDKAAILSRKPRIEMVDVPEWDGSIGVKAMSGLEREGWELEQAGLNEAGRGMENVQARLLARTLCDEQGNRHFGDHEIGDIGQLEGRGLARVFRVAMRLNALDAQSHEDIEKN